MKCVLCGAKATSTEKSGCCARSKGGVAVRHHREQVATGLRAAAARKRKESRRFTKEADALNLDHGGYKTYIEAGARLSAATRELGATLCDMVADSLHKQEAQ